MQGLHHDCRFIDRPIYMNVLEEVRGKIRFVTVVRGYIRTYSLETSFGVLEISYIGWRIEHYIEYLDDSPFLPLAPFLLAIV